MDPWIIPSTGDEERVASPADLEHLHNPATTTTFSPDNINSSLLQTKSLFFDDDFKPQPSSVGIPSAASDSDSDPKPFSKLPDSDQYLASLENKLAKVQKTGGKKEPSTILQGLSQTRESCMIQLLSNSVAEGNTSIEEFLSDEVKVNLLLKKLAPEKQAISAEELIHLLTADQLELTLERESTEQDEDAQNKPEK